MNAVFIHSPELDIGGYPVQCPFNTKRAGRTRKTVEAMDLLSGPDRREAPPVALTREELEWFHTGAYLDALARARVDSVDEALVEMGLGTPDCPVFDGMYDYVRLASGGTLTGARMILSGEAHVAFNPSGGLHHAMPGRAAGFCYVNDIVIACMELARAGKRVCFLDIDVHHGDGVQHAFYGRKDVLTVSLHESGKTLFPGTGFESEMGQGEGYGYSVNIPMPVGAYDAVYERAFREAAWPVITAYDPDVIVLEIGMDVLAGDPLAHLHLTNNVPADIVAKVMKLGKPVLATGGGGYNVAHTVRGWALCWGVLCGEDQSHDLMIGMGGVMLENTDWIGGLRDRMLLSDAGVRGRVDEEVQETIARIRTRIFPLHGL